MTSPESRFEQLVLDYMDGSLAGNDREALERGLLKDPAALDLLCGHALLESQLRRVSAATRRLDHKRSELIWRSQRQRMWSTAMAIAAGVVLMIGLGLYAVMAPQLKSHALIEISPMTSYSISGGGSSNPDGRLEPGSTLSLAQGTARITLPDGTTCHAEAPASLTLKSMEQLYLAGGVARFDVAKGSEGFTVTTRDLEIVDLGTRFGVDDRIPGQPQVHVIEGSVRATARRGRHESTIVSVGDATAVAAAGTLRPVPYDADRFPAALPPGLPAVRFSFDDPPEQGLSASGSLAKALDIRVADFDTIDHPPGLIAGPHGNALSFTDRRQQLTTTWQGIDGTLPRSFACWIRIEPGQEAGGRIASWGLPSGGKRMSEIGLSYSGGRRAALRINSGLRWLQSITRIDDGNWHHIAFVLDRHIPGSWPNVRFYLDGKREPLTPREPLPQDGRAASFDTFETITHHPGSLPLTLGSFGREKTANSFIGEIDEVIVAAGILNENHIRALHRGDLGHAGIALDR